MAESKLILVLTADLMSSTRVHDTLSRLGYQVKVAEDDEEMMALLGQAPAGLIIIDLAAPGLSLPNLVQEANGKLPQTPILAFGSHMDTQRLAAATAAGCTKVVSRSRFFTEMASLIHSFFTTSDIQQG